VEAGTVVQRSWTTEIWKTTVKTSAALGGQASDDVGCHISTA